MRAPGLLWGADRVCVLVGPGASFRGGADGWGRRALALCLIVNSVLAGLKAAGSKPAVCRETPAESSWDIPAWALKGADSERGPKQGESLLGIPMPPGKGEGLPFPAFHA